MCKYCWHPKSFSSSKSILVEEVFHNPGCPVVEGNFTDWEKGADWGWNNSTASSREFPQGKSPAFYMGIRSGRNQMEELVQSAAEDCYYSSCETDY